MFYRKKSAVTSARSQFLTILINQLEHWLSKNNVYLSAESDISTFI